MELCLEICVTKIISQKSFGYIFKGQILGSPTSASVLVKVTSQRMVGTPAVGEIWDVNGPETMTAWGRQIDALTAARNLPTGNLVKKFLSDRCPGIGPTRSQRLWDRYGMDLSAVLTESNLHELAKVIEPDRPILGSRLASYVVFSWKEAKAESDLITWFQGFGIDDFFLVRVCLKLFGDKAPQKITKSPYIFSSMLDWAKCDRFGLKILSESHQLDKPHLAPERLLGAIDSSMRDVLAEGNTCVTKTDLQKILAKKLIRQKDYPSDLPVRAIALAIENNAIIQTKENKFLPPGANYLENRVKTILLAISDLENSNYEKSILEKIINELSKGYNPPDEEQLLAIISVIKQGLSCLVGGAGTGKTTTLRYIVHLWKRLGGNVLLCALAGKAALRLSQSTGVIAKTIAMTLRDISDNSHDVCIDDDTLFIIDEASMLDLPTMYKILKTFTPRTKLLLCGDPAQLPPIGFGLIFHKLVHDNSITSRLTKVYRQTETSGIPYVASKIRKREVPEFIEFSGIGQGVSFIDSSIESIPNVIESVVAELGGFNNEELLIVTATNGGSSGIEDLNKKFHDIHREINKCAEIKGFLGQYFSSGEPVIHLRNDYKRALFNGSLGYIAEINTEDNSLLANFDDEMVNFEHEQLIDLYLAYAITCHKCQGSQVKRIIIPIYKTKLMDPSWIYTAITRATDQVVMIGDRCQLFNALQRNFSASTRQVGFNWN